jgi:predicted Ser/Thr protein kinase
MTPAGRRVGRYEIVRAIGEGGMASVYLARQTDLDRDVALKELRVFEGSDPELARRFLAEARLAGSLSHPNIVTVHEYFEDHARPYIAMEYVAGGSLRQYVGRLSLAQIGGVLEGVLGGLAHAEEHGIVHRDIKPENIMVTPRGSVKIADFGIAKATSVTQASLNLTATGTTLGTPRYMAPERAMGQEIGPWSDLYSVGVMVFELLVGRTPFYDTEVPMAVLMRQINDPIPPVSSLVPDVDPALSRWVERLVAKDPAERTRFAADAWEELEGILIDVLGPRWGRAAGIGGEAHGRTPARAARSRASSYATVGAVPTAPTAPMDPDPAPATTVAPRTLPTEPRARPREPSTRHVPRAMRLVLAVGVLLAGVAAAAGGGAHRASSPTGAATTAVGNGAIRVAAPAGWSRTTPRVDAGLPVSHAVTVARADRTSQTITAGRLAGATAANASLLPPALLQENGVTVSDVPARTRVLLPRQGIQAWRYRGLRRPGSTQSSTIFVVPTTAGVAAVVCEGPARRTFERACDAVAGTLELGGATTYPLGPSQAYAGRLNGVLDELRRQASAHGTTLAAASAPQPRRRAALALARDYGDAARVLRMLDLSPADRHANQRLAAAIDQTAAAYGRVAATAPGGDSTATDAAMGSVGAGEGAIDAALTELSAAGYRAGTITSGGSPTPAATPAPVATLAPATRPHRDSGVGDSRSDDPSDDAPDN